MGFTDDLILSRLYKSREDLKEPDSLIKAIDKAKLVQKDVQVQTKTGIITRKQWVKAGEEPKTERRPKAQDEPKGRTTKQSLISDLQSGKSRDDIMVSLKQQGINWEESPNEAINWIRATKALSNNSTPAPASSSGGDDGGDKEDNKSTQTVYTSSSEKEQEENSYDEEGFKEVSSPEEFNQLFNEARDSQPKKDRWRVAKHNTEDYTSHNCKMFATKGGSTFAVTDKGDIISVCVNANSSDRGKTILAKAVANGGKTLDAYDGIFGFYAKCGFTPVSWCEGDKEILRAYVDDWDESENDIENVVFFTHSEDSNSPYTSFEDFSNSINPEKDYDTAEEKRNKTIKTEEVTDHEE